MSPETSNGDENSRPPGRRERKAAEMRERIFEAAIKLIAQRGLDNVTIEQITEAADVGKGTFFNYFANKEAVLTYFGAKQAQRLREAVACGEVAGTAPAKIECVLELLARNVDISPELARGTFISVLSEHRATDVYGPDVWSIQEVLSDIVREGQSSGDFSPRHDPVQAGQFMLGQYYLGMLSWCSGFSDESLVETVLRFGRLAMTGLNG